MDKLFLTSRRIITPILLASSFTLSAIETNQAMVDFSISMMKQEGEIEKLANCTGKPENAIELFMRSAMTKCMKFVDDEQAGKACMEREFQSNIGVSEKQLLACQSPEDKLKEQLAKLEAEYEKLEQQQQKLYDKDELNDVESAQLDRLDEQLEQIANRRDDIELQIERLNMSEEELALEKLYDEIGDEEPTQAQQRKIDQLMAQQMAQQMKQQKQSLKNFARAMQVSSLSTTEQITLPLYKNSQVMAHISSQGQVTMGDITMDALPAATFSSPDKPSDILKFYQQALPDFEFKQDGDSFILMEKMPKDFDLLKNIKDYTSTPHIYISKAKDSSEILPKGTQAIIEIAYRL